MTIMLTPETEARLCEKALRKGAEVHAVAEALIATALESEERDFQEAVAGIEKGLEASRQGRVRSAQEVFADLQMKLTRQKG
jgi:predicted transcriptional regulator